MIPRSARFDIIPSEGRNTSKHEWSKRKLLSRLRNTGKKRKVRETNIVVSIQPSLRQVGALEK